jgi:hypothetical protein
VISGGRRIEDWEVGADGRWRVALPEVQGGDWAFSQLFVGDQRRFRPRVPASGYFRVTEQLPPTAAAEGRGHDRFGFAAGELDAGWHRLEDVEVFAFHLWSASRMRIASIDEDARAVTFTGPTRTVQRWGSFPAGHRWRVVNVAKALDEPGEWYLDRGTGELTYLSLPGEDPSATAVVAPRIETLLRLAGDVGARQFVEHVRFEGLTFAHAGWSLPPQGQSFPQAEVHLGAAVEAAGARDVRFTRCAVRNVGRYAVELGAGCRDVAIEACELFDLGAGGVKIGAGGGVASWAVGSFDASDPETAVERVSVRDTRIVSGGRLHPAAVGVWIGHASHCVVERCEIADLYYTGVSVGWTWGYAEPSRAHHNEVAFNHMHDLGQGVLSDLGGVYTLGISPGTTVHDNVIHDVEAFDYGGWGLYTDEGSTGIELTRNLVYRTKTGGFHQHYGRENLVANNLFAEALVQQVQRTRTEEHRSFTFERNVVWWTNDSPLLGSNWRDDGFVLDRNVYWNPVHGVRFPGDLTLEEWRARRGQDAASVVADPLIRDPDADDWRLREGSPALALGFEPLTPERAGPAGAARLCADLPPAPPGFE